MLNASLHIYYQLGSQAKAEVQPSDEVGVTILNCYSWAGNVQFSRMGKFILYD